MDATERTRLEANIWKIKLNFFLTNFFIYSSILMITFQEKGFSYTGIGILLFIATAVGLVFNVPMGILADRWGRKYVLMLAAISGIISMFLWTSSIYLIVLIGMIFRSFVDACIQGTDTALLYDTLKDLGRESEYTKHNSNKFSLAMLGFGIAAILASLIPRHGEYTYHFLLTGIAFFGALLVSWSLYEPSHHKKATKGPLGHLKHSFDVIRKHRELKKVVTYTYIISGCLILLTYFQFFMKQSGIPVQSFGFIYAGLGAISALASYYAFNVERNLGEKTMLAIMPTLFALSAFLFIVARGPALVIMALIAAEVFLGFQGAILNTYLQRHVESAYRSTVDSLTGFYGAGYRAVMYLCMGLLADLLNIEAAMTLLLVTSLVLIIPPLYFLLKEHTPQNR